MRTFSHSASVIGVSYHKGAKHYERRIFDGYYYDLVCVLGRLFAGHGGLTVDIWSLTDEGRSIA